MRLNEHLSQSIPFLWRGISYTCYCECARVKRQERYIAWQRSIEHFGQLVPEAKGSKRVSTRPFPAYDASVVDIVKVNVIVTTEHRASESLSQSSDF